MNRDLNIQKHHQNFEEILQRKLNELYEILDNKE